MPEGRPGRAFYTGVVTVLELLLVAGSGLTLEPTSAVSVTDVCVVVPGRKNVSVSFALAPEANWPIWQDVAPVPPTAGLVHVKTGPLVCLSETNVVPAGTASFIVTDRAE